MNRKDLVSRSLSRVRLCAFALCLCVRLCAFALCLCVRLCALALCLWSPLLSPLRPHGLSTVIVLNRNVSNSRNHTSVAPSCRPLSVVRSPGAFARCIRLSASLPCSTQGLSPAAGALEPLPPLPLASLSLAAPSGLLSLASFRLSVSASVAPLSRSPVPAFAFLGPSRLRYTSAPSCLCAFVSAPPRLRAFVPSCLRASAPSCLCAFAPPCPFRLRSCLRCALPLFGLRLRFAVSLVPRWRSAALRFSSPPLPSAPRNWEFGNLGTGFFGLVFGTGFLDWLF